MKLYKQYNFITTLNFFDTTVHFSHMASPFAVFFFLFNVGKMSKNLYKNISRMGKGYRTSNLSLI